MAIYDVISLETAAMIIISVFSTLYAISQRVAKNISQKEAAALAGQVKWALSAESDAGSSVSSVEAIKLIATAVEAYESPTKP